MLYDLKVKILIFFAHILTSQRKIPMDYNKKMFIGNIGDIKYHISCFFEKDF
jgi:hypothetical protein